MTAPQPPQPTDLQRASWANDAALLALEAATTALILHGISARLRAALRSVTGAWVITLGGVNARPASSSQARSITTLAESLMDEVGTELEQALEPLPRSALAAYVLGVRQAGGELERRPQRPTPHVPEGTPAAIRHQLDVVARLPQAPPAPEQLIHEREQARIAKAVLSQIDKAKQLLDADHVTTEGFIRVQRALAEAGKVEQRVQDAVAWHLLDANQQGVSDEAKRRGRALIWVAERDACVVCQALSGDVVDPGQSFDVEATYGRKAALPAVWPKPDYLGHPPRHNRCRCRCELHDRQDTGVVTALKREGRRAIVYGYRTDGQSSSERRDAADRLLARGARLPKTVEARARRMVRNPVPFGGPVPEFEP